MVLDGFTPGWLGVWSAGSMDRRAGFYFSAFVCHFICNVWEQHM